MKPYISNLIPYIKDAKAKDSELPAIPENIMVQLINTKYLIMNVLFVSSGTYKAIHA